MEDINENNANSTKASDGLEKGAAGIKRYEIIAQNVCHSISPNARNQTKYLIYLFWRKILEAVPGSDLLLNLDRHGYKLHTGD